MEIISCKKAVKCKLMHSPRLMHVLCKEQCRWWWCYTAYTTSLLWLVCIKCWRPKHESSPPGCQGSQIHHAFLILPSNRTKNTAPYSSKCSCCIPGMRCLVCNNKSLFVVAEQPPITSYILQPTPRPCSASRTS